MNQQEKKYLIRVIKDFQSEVKKYVTTLEKEFKTQSYYEARKEKIIPRTGRLSDGTDFFFHGVGCRFELPSNLTVDFDYGPEGRYDGFDLWRIKNFVDERLSIYFHYEGENILEKEFQEMIDAGIVKKIPNDNLYYLADSFDND